MKALPNFKRGDSFTLDCIYKVAGVASSITGKTIASQIRNVAGELVQTLAFTARDQGLYPGQFILAATAAQSALWPIAGLRCDIQITEGGVVISSDTFLVPVVQDITL